jgi:O-antigen/teichoic acid export membrane protein
LVIGRVVFVDLAEKKRLGLSLHHTYLKVVEIVTATLWPAFAGLAVLAGPFILKVYGAKWTLAALPLAMLSINAIIQLSFTMAWEIFAVSGETARQSRFEFIRAGAGLVFLVIGCTTSLTAACMAWIAHAIFSMFLYLPHLQRMTDTTSTDFRPVYLRSAVLTLGAIGPAALLMVIFHGSPTTPFNYVLGSVIAGVIIWSLGLVLLRHPLLLEALRFVRRWKPTVA